MAEGKSDFFDRLMYGVKNGPKSGSGFFDLAQPLLWAMGRPDTMMEGRGLNEYFYNRAIQRGQNPADVIPGWAGGSSAAAAPADDPSTKGLAPWYVDWLRSSGRHGGVPPVRGLL